MHPVLCKSDDDEEEEPNILLLPHLRSRPVFFSMAPGEKRPSLRNRVIVRGSIVKQVEMLDEDDTRIMLGDPDMDITDKVTDVFDCKYVDDCIEINELLENLCD
jgi:hypothetical protein